MSRDDALAVCLLTETYYPVTGGGETQARVLAAGFTRNGSTVHVLTRRTGSRQAKKEELDGAVVWRLSPTGPGHLKKWGLVITAFAKLWRLRHDYDVILVAGYRVMGIPSVIAARLFGKPCILKADSIGEFSGEFFNPGLRRFRLRHDRFPVNLVLKMRNKLLGSADRFVAISNVIADELIEHGASRDRIVRIPNSVNTDLYRPVDNAQKEQLRGELGIVPEMIVGIYTGRLVHTKGLPMLLRCWRRVAERHGNVLLLLVGSGGVGIQNCERQLKDFVRENELENVVRFTGSVDDVYRYLQASDFFVFPTEREAFGISIIEALACCLPVITTATGGVNDIVDDGDNAIVVPVDDETALTEALVTVMTDDVLTASLAAAGRQTAIERYSENSILRRYNEMFVDLAESVNDD